MGLFSTTGIRGIANETFTPDFALDLARTYGTMLKQGSNILIACDTRTSSEMIKNSAIAGILETGCNVVDTGVVPIPVLNFAVSRGYDAGIMVTSSHNPPEYNGMKFILSNGNEISEKDEKKFEQIYASRKFRKVSWKKIGKYKEHSVISDYEKAVLDILKSRQFNLKVVLDIGNGAQGVVAPNLFKKLKCETILLHSKMDGFFERGPEPRPEKLGKLKEVVLSEHADFGVAFDTDGDRAIFVTDNGEVLMGDVTGSLLAGEILRENKKGLIVTTIATSSLIDDIVKKHKGKLIKTKVGGKIVGDVLLKKKGHLGFEENGGCMFPQISPARDGSLTAAKIAELIACSGKPLSKLAGELPKYYQMKARVECEDKFKSKIINYVIASAKKESAKKIDLTDGAKIFFKDNAWVLIRPSGTEPIFRIFVESKNEKRSRDLEKWGIEKVQNSIQKA